MRPEIWSTMPEIFGSALVAGAVGGGEGADEVDAAAVARHLARAARAEHLRGRGRTCQNALAGGGAVRTDRAGARARDARRRAEEVRDYSQQ